MPLVMVVHADASLRGKISKIAKSDPDSSSADCSVGPISSDSSFTRPHACMLPHEVLLIPGSVITSGASPALWDITLNPVVTEREPPLDQGK